ncbi:MAG: hypothetical protein ACPGFB_11115 [Verrucomicrobiales bacterium]
MSQPYVAVQLSEGHRKKSRGSLLWFWMTLAMVFSATGGWFGRQALENREDLVQHAEVLRPFLAYNRDYDELRARSMNDDMRVVSFHIYQAWKEGLDLREVLDLAMPVEQVPPNLKRLTIDRLIENHEQAMRYGLYTPDNLALLSRGKAPTVSKGKYAGAEAQVEHIVPKNVVPLMDNLLVNLEWLPQPLNASKSDRITPRALKYARRYYEAELMSQEDFLTVQERAEQ